MSNRKTPGTSRVHFDIVALMLLGYLVLFKDTIRSIEYEPDTELGEDDSPLIPQSALDAGFLDKLSASVEETVDAVGRWQKKYNLRYDSPLLQVKWY